jgi:hypothetical protein
MNSGGDRLASQRSSLRGVYATSPAFFCFLGIAALLVLLWSLGLQLNGDADDLVKLHEIRTFLETGRIFDRTLPGILQPEPYVTHWPWIVDLPYAAFASIIKPFIGFEPSVMTASFVVPLLLLAPALHCYSRLVIAVGFTSPVLALPLASIFAIRAFFEFAPGRIDYHNLQVLLLLITLVLTLSQKRLAAFANGVMAAMALAISVEFAPFYALVMAIYAFDFVFSRQDGARRIFAFGLALAIGAAALFAVIVPPSAYATAKCDTFSAPHVLALVAAGLSFVITPTLAGRRSKWAMRATILLAFATASVATLLMLFPQCVAGPYATLDFYVRDNILDSIPQELSLFRRPDFVLSASFPGMMLMFVGALAPAVVCLNPQCRSRPLVIMALFSVLALGLAIGYFRYFRYLPVFSSVGLSFVLASFLPPGTRLAAYLTPHVPVGSRRYRLIVPGLVLSVAMALYQLSARTSPAAIPAAEFADSCDLSHFELRWGWPAGAIVLTPPLIGAHFLALAEGPRVVTVPNHPSALGLGRSYRFLDPSTVDPRMFLDASKATHVALCAWRSSPSQNLETAYPFAATLMEGHPPSWLRECPTDASSPLRLYSYRNADASDATCPASTAFAQALP